MYNWCLLLLASLAVIQPIASFIDRSLVDGRQQCCDSRVSRNTRSAFENYRAKPYSDRSLINHREWREGFRTEHFDLHHPTVLRESQNTELFRSSSEPVIRRLYDQQIRSRTQTRNLNMRNLHENFDDRVSRQRTNTDNLKYIEIIRERRLTNERITDDRVKLNPILTIRTTRDIYRVNDRVAQGERRKNLERTNNNIRRDLTSRDESRYQRNYNRLSGESLDRYARDIREYRRESSEEFMKLVSNKRGVARSELNERVQNRGAQITDRIILRRIDSTPSYSRMRSVHLYNNGNRHNRDLVRNGERRTTVEMVTRRSLSPLVSRHIEIDREERYRRLSSSERRSTNVLKSGRDSLGDSRDRRPRSLENRRESDLKFSANERRSLNIHESRIQSRDRYSRDASLSRQVRERISELNNNSQLRERLEATRASERLSVADDFDTIRKNIRMRNLSKNEVRLRLDNHHVREVRETTERRSEMSRNARTWQSNEREVHRDMNRDLLNKDASIQSRTQDIQYKGIRWQYFMYSMQAIYLCTIIIPLLMKTGHSKKQKMSTTLGDSFIKIFKVD